MNDLKLRHIFKAISWRILGSLDTLVLTFILTGDFTVGIHISVIEFVTKTFLYYFHERLWFKFKYFKQIPSKTRHLLKTITWRFIGSIDTVFIGWFVANDLKIGVYLGGLELITKMVLYYFHERIWYKLKFGIER